MCARTADQNPPTTKVTAQGKELSRTYIEQEMKKVMEIFFEANEQSKPAGSCPFCGKGQLAAQRLTDSQNLNKGGVWCNKCNFRFML